jgi:glutamate dehydrogenase
MQSNSNHDIAAGYSSNVFHGKNEQMIQVSSYVAEKGFIPKELVENEVSWFYGLDLMV